MFRSILPELSHIESFDGDPHSWFVTLEGRVGTLFRMDAVDLEDPDASTRMEEFERILKKLEPSVLIRLILRSATTFDSPWETARKEAISRLGWARHDLFLCIETATRSSFLGRWLLGHQKGSTAWKEIQALRAAMDSMDLGRFDAVALSESEIRTFFNREPSQVIQSKIGLESAFHHTGAIRLWRQGIHELDWTTLARIRESLRPPYRVVVNLRKIPDTRAQYLLQRLRGQKAASPDSLSLYGREKAEEALQATLIEGRSLLEVEWLMVLERKSEEALKEDLGQSCQVLERLGDITAEVRGAAPSYRASLPGGELHHFFVELDHLVPFFCPVGTRGEGRVSGAVAPCALPLHRRDGSIFHFDPFRPEYDGANILINGRRGRGKSVLANLISSSLLNDPRVSLIKVDVGGSYVKECRLLGGREVRFQLSEPSGLNPFRILQTIEYREDAAAIVTTLLTTLLQESGEAFLPKSLIGSIERAVMAFSESRPPHPTLGAFLSGNPDIPRKDLLRRFCEGGIFANVLRELPERESMASDRYTYFNFEQLQNAANEDFSQAVMAAVIATVNLEMLRAGDARRGSGRRLVFFADETPFFIQKNGRFFKLTTANFRKFGHGTVLISQMTQDFELVKTGGGRDTGILSNSPIRFFFEVDDEPESFATRFGLSLEQVLEIQALGRTENYREVFLQGDRGGRVLRIAVTPEEYWRVTSSREDNEKLEALIRFVPGLSLKEAIRCLSV